MVECPHGAIKTLPANLEDAYFYLNIDAGSICDSLGLSELSDQLPCWVPQRVLSMALFGDAGETTVDQAISEQGPWVWVTEFSNVHDTFASSFTEPPIQVDECIYRHGPEEYFQQAKSVGQPDHAAAVKAMGAIGGPMDAFDVGRRYSLRPDWEEVKVGVMRRAVLAKFTQHEGLKALLLSTANHRLVQLKPSDGFWGTGREGGGRNELGGMLMEMRAAWRGEDERKEV